MSVLTARGAGVRRRRRWLFRDLEVAVEPGETVAVVGPPGSGRTTVLLALARRFRLSAGRVAVAGTAALGHVPDVSAPEPVFTVAEHVRERLALLGRPRSEAAGVPLHGLDPGRRGRELSPYEKQVLGLILAGLSRPAVIALDGVDDGLDAAEQAELWRLLGEIAAAGTAVLVTAREIDAARVSTVIRLGPEPSVGSTGTPRPPENAGPRTAAGEGPLAPRGADPQSSPGVDPRASVLVEPGTPGGETRRASASVEPSVPATGESAVVEARTPVDAEPGVSDKGGRAAAGARADGAAENGEQR